LVGATFGSYGFSIAVYVIGIMIAIGGIILGIGFALNNKKLKEFGREELIQSVINGALVGGLLLLFAQNGLVNSLIYSLTVTNGTKLQCSAFLASNAAICLSYDYLVGPGYTWNGVSHQSILSLITSLMVGLLALNTVLGIVASVKFTLFIITFSFESVIAPLLMQIRYLTNILTTLAIGATVQASVLIFIAISAVSVMLPAGLVIRTFYPTRKLGGFLIATAVGLYVVFPLSYVFNAAILNTYYTNINQTSMNQLTLSAKQVKNNVVSTAGQANPNDTSIFSSLSNLVSNLASSFSKMMDKLFSLVAYFILSVFILPIFSLIMTGISIRELASVLGSEAFFGKFDLL
jgi:hypothetical protein